VVARQRTRIWVYAVCLPVWAQTANAPDLEAQAAALRALVGKAPQAKLERTQIKLQPPAAGWEIGYPPAVTMDDAGAMYILHRGDKVDPVLVVNRDGKILRSWGKGLYQIPHSIRIDPQGNVWTVDSGSSMVLKFTPKGEKLMEISVGEQPAGRGRTNGTSDIAFGPNGRIYISDGYGNARVLEYNAKGERVRQWGSAGTGPGQFNQPHGIAVDDQGIVYVADRNNARVQRFDLNGKYLGEWNHLGKVTAIGFRDGALWIGTQYRNLPNEADGWHMRIDRKTGKIVELTESGRSHHVLNINHVGELLSGARPDLPWWFQNTK
jgi:DNA-binding beta-propeller fold protein YncE